MPLFLAGQSFTEPNRRRAVIPAAVASAFDPTTVAGLKLAFDASDAATITATGNELTEWADTGSIGRNIVRDTVGPTTGVDTKNGLNVLTFNATTTKVQFSGGGALSLVAQPDTILFVAKIDTITANRHLCDGGAARQLITGDGATWRLYAGSAALTGGTADTNWHVFCAKFNGASSVLRVDGVEVISGNPGTNALAESWRIARGTGANDCTASKWAQVLVYDSALGATDTDYLEDGLAVKWGI